MSGDRLTSATQALLKVARTDGPNAAARAKVWSGVSAAVGGAAGAAAAGAGAGGSGVATSAVGVSAAKMLVSGTLLGGVVTVGLAALLLHFGPLRPSPAHTARAGEPQSPATSMAPPAPPVDDSFAGACTGASLNWAPGTLAAPPSLVARPAPATLHSSVKPSHGITAGDLHAPSAQPATADDSLTREASLVAEARAALAAGNAQEALRLVRSARSMRAPQLVPEELTVEAQALRALGKTDDAQGVDATLHSQYPDSALAR